MRHSDEPILLADIEKRLRLHVDRLAGLVGPRHLGKPSSLEAAARYVERELACCGDPVTSELYCVGDAAVANYYIERAGYSNPESVVIVGAHYDTVPTTPGADDNASAVAVLLETARLMHGVRLRRTVRFVSFACEEPPHFYTDTMGSQVHARLCVRRGERVAAMICLEMVGYFTDQPQSQQTPPGIPRPLTRLFPSTGNFLASVGNLRSAAIAWRFHRGFRRSSALRLFSVALPERVHAIRLSDNSSFWDQGYPALMVTDTSFLRNPHYHLASDTPDTLDYPRMAQVVLGVVGGVTSLAGGRVPEPRRETGPAGR
ncbi:MAG: M28 family peptidase [Phycisphaerales bacterium]